VSARKGIIQPPTRTAGYPDFDLCKVPSYSPYYLSSCEDPAFGSRTKPETSEYPHFDLYPPVGHSRHSTLSKPESVFVSHYQYPAFSLCMSLLNIASKPADNLPRPRTISFLRPLSWICSIEEGQRCQSYEYSVLRLSLIQPLSGLRLSTL
jgi:hypothetical protein